jgi:anti-sigma regulatory factor (Ser/Thr protein kinase)
VSRPDAFALVLATVEAFTNAVEHAHQQHSRRAHRWVDWRRLRVDFRSRSRHWHTKSRKEQGGLGLSIIEVLMDSVRVDRGPEGTTVTMSRRLVSATPN